MKNFINKIYLNHSLIYKVFLFIITVFTIVYLFPKEGYFRYDFPKGKPWQNENLYAPFDFAIQKSSETLEIEKNEITKNAIKYFEVNTNATADAIIDFDIQLNKKIATDSLVHFQKKYIQKKVNQLIQNIYEQGFLDPNSEGIINNPETEIALRKANEIEPILYKNLITSKTIFEIINTKLNKNISENERNILLGLLSEVLKPNVFFDQKYSDFHLQEKLNAISGTTGFVSKGELIIAKGNIVEGRKLLLLNSLKHEYESLVWSKNNYYWIVFGYTLLVALTLFMLLLFLKKNRPHIYEDNTKVTFIIINILLMIFLATITVKYQVKYIYIVPLIILPIVIKAFFDARLGLFVHVLTVLLLGFIVPNSFEFIFLQIIAGVVTILTVSELYKRANLFISLGKITFVYMLTYFSFYILHEGNISEFKWTYFGHFILNGIFSFLVLFLVLVYEKIFGLVSDVTLLELCNTNSKLLRTLNEKAPGTFQHSMQVANLAEAVSNEIGANTMLVRTGALYHDIGKISKPKYFIENQITGVNPHDELPAVESSEIIVNHVLKGIEIAKKNRLPDRIIDFIRTHHGTSTVYYFYKKASEEAGAPVDENNFKYPGPIPFSKETAIVMMVDACEAASKSLKEHTAQIIDSLVEKIIDKQLENGQFSNASITFKEITIAKKIIKKKLKSIYHLRVEYPE